MIKKSSVVITSILLSTSLLVGCNTDEPNDEDRSELQQQMRYNPNNVNYDRYDYDRGDNDLFDNDLDNDLDNDRINNRNINAPGVDEDDNIFKDDENDADPDPEDIIEDPKDMMDRDRRDE